MYHYYMFNKPFGCVCARRDDRYPTVMDYFSDLDNPDLSPVGRLDRATEGLLLVTDVCVTATSVLKEVLPTLHPEIQSASCHNRPEHPIVFGEITVTEGKKHQVRRMLKAVGCCIIALKRVTMGNFTLDETLAPGEFKEIFPEL